MAELPSARTMSGRYKMLNSGPNLRLGAVWHDAVGATRVSRGESATALSADHRTNRRSGRSCRDRRGRCCAHKPIDRRSAPAASREGDDEIGARWRQRYPESAGLRDREFLVRPQEAQKILSAEDKVAFHRGARLGGVSLLQSRDHVLVLGCAHIFVLAFAAPSTSASPCPIWTRPSISSSTSSAASRSMNSAPSSRSALDADAAQSPPRRRHEAAEVLAMRQRL